MIGTARGAGTPNTFQEPGLALFIPGELYISIYLLIFCLDVIERYTKGSSVKVTECVSNVLNLKLDVVFTNTHFWFHPW